MHLYLQQLSWQRSLILSRFYQEEALFCEKFWSSRHVTRCNTEPNSLHTCGLAAAVDCVPLHLHGFWVIGQASSLNHVKKICNIGNSLSATAKKCHLRSVLSNPYFWYYHQFCCPFRFHLYLLQHPFFKIMFHRNRQYSSLGWDAIRKQPC